MPDTIASDTELASDPQPRRQSKTVSLLIKQIQELYLSDPIPWVVGYSGGKDSTAVLQLVWRAIADLPKNQQIKTVHVISTDTLVENPIVALWVENSLRVMSEQVRKQILPIQPHRLTPKVQDRFWVNLIGRGYPAPRPKFRWCTSRLKISPSNDFINNVVQANGEAILVLGTRKSESSTRAANMKKYEQGSTRKSLSRNKELDRVWVYSPIADWTNDDVWQFLLQNANPWGYRNEDLLVMYRGATADGECPLVVDSSTPSCGDSRFGCYVCTMVGEDKSLAAMIQNDDEKEWMLPLLELRNKWLGITDPDDDKKKAKLEIERERRDFRRMNGSLTLHNGRLVHGPYKQTYRAQLLEAVLEAESKVRELGPEEVRNLDLLTIEDLEEIRRIWVMEKHEIEDVLPSIYEKVRGEPYPGDALKERQLFGGADMALLSQVCEEQQEASDRELHYELVRDLLHVEYQHRTMVRRKKLFDVLNKTLERGVFQSEAEAKAFAMRQQANRDEISGRLTTDIPGLATRVEEVSSLDKDSCRRESRYTDQVPKRIDHTT